MIWKYGYKTSKERIVNEFKLKYEIIRLQTIHFEDIVLNDGF
jgi:hypothetical protein